MDKHDVLQKIPLDMYDECDYTETKEMYFDKFNELSQSDCDVITSVCTAYYQCYDMVMDENGMDKFVAMLSGMLYMIEHECVDPDVAYGTSYDIKDFETGDYDYLFTPVDLELIKSDKNS